MRIPLLAAPRLRSRPVPGVLRPIRGASRPVRGVPLATAIATLLAASSVAAGPVQLDLPNGIRATVHSADEVMASMTTRRGGHLWLDLQPGLSYQLVTDVADPGIVNKGDGRFHPMSVVSVVEALQDVQIEDARVEIQVYLLPYPRRDVVDSSAREGMILLTPGVLPVNGYAVHFTVAHEVGHVYQYQWLPDSDLRGWQRYNSLRGIDNTAIYHADGEHKNRPHEIFAEDFRFLFGGEAANYSGSIENDELHLPTEVTGLADFLRGLPEMRHTSPAARLRSSPNPFNPITTIQVQFEEPPAAGARLSVFDVLGREVRRLYEGAPGGRHLFLPWDGRSADGEPVASGLYFARLDYLGESISTKLVLVK